MSEELLKEAAGATADPRRSLQNLRAFLGGNPGRTEELLAHLRGIAVLFSASQFLANYSNADPDALFSAVSTADIPLSREDLQSELGSLFDEARMGAPGGGRPLNDLLMGIVRTFRLRRILKITLRDIMGKADLSDTFVDLSMLADVIIEKSLSEVRRFLSGQYGSPSDDGFAVIALGKLGAEELNFSSDVDLMFVYGDDAGETSGVSASGGTRRNRISNHEYYCKTGEALSRFLSMNTERGFAYRVDMRLRPEGQRGALALPLRGYETYYESWGRAWERAMLIRARPVAGEPAVGRDFMALIKPFVYRKYLDFSAIDEIRSLKTRIDATFKKGDIKRGYGGIREIEFFTQALQLIYGGREFLLRERNTLKTLHRLMQKSLIGQEDYAALSDNYRFLRTVEHRLQQLNDLQTHTLPAGPEETVILARKLGFPSGDMFTEEIEKRRTSVRRIYDSLFGEKGEPPSLSGTFFDEDLPDAELREILQTGGLKDPAKAARHIRAIRESMYSFQTLRGRRLLGEILPLFVDAALRSSDPDSVLNHLQSFAGLLSTQESYLEIFSRDRFLVDTLVYLFAQSPYLTKVLLPRPQYLELIGWQEDPKKSLRELMQEMSAAISAGHSISDAARILKQGEEIRLGLLFLRAKMGVRDIVRGLSKVADCILATALDQMKDEAGSLAVIGLGKLGGREITFGSDLDLVFVSAGDVTVAETRAAERLLRMLISYTKEGVAYRVDTRLRPEGSKGPLVSSVEAFRKYYASSAQSWELQALLRARPVAGDRNTGRFFLQMARDALAERGSLVLASDIRTMRERILRELSKESSGYDIKLGPGGIEELEFAVQFLQLKECGTAGCIMVQGFDHALKRLSKAGVLRSHDGRRLGDAYAFYRTIESLLRLREEGVLSRDERALEDIATFCGYDSSAAFVAALKRTRKTVVTICRRYLADS